MNPAQLAPVVATAGLVLVVTVIAAVIVALLATRTGRRRWQAELDSARADVASLTARLDAIDFSRTHEQPSAPAAPTPEFVITSLPDGPAPLHLAGPVADPGASTSRSATESVEPTIGQFAAVAVGESLVRLVSLGFGVRRALSAESRNRIRFEMRREVKRARRQRRRDLKEAKRHLRHLASESAEDAA